jgi:hypothetical protein
MYVEYVPGSLLPDDVETTSVLVQETDQTESLSKIWLSAHDVDGCARNKDLSANETSERGDTRK